MVRGQDGRIVAIGGLMRQATTSDQPGAGLGDVPLLGGCSAIPRRSIQKRELVVLIKPTIVDVRPATRRSCSTQPPHRTAGAARGRN
jgi:MSHA biogenesis protein MshL